MPHSFIPMSKKAAPPQSAQSYRPEATLLGVLLLPPIYHSGVVSSFPQSWAFQMRGEMRGLGFNQIQCGNRVVRLHGASPRPAVAIASRVPKPVNQNRVAGHSFETTYSWYGSARELLLPGLAPIRE
jgi:hypothetical protein